ncbi:MAG: class I SAM-dependent methyltransferase [Clostridia bacterium]|nr:class I SAM-dependent methyltransferase [Clostridia bacterium]
MYSNVIDKLKTRPTAYTPNAQPFWEDAHISKHMLKAHLNPELDAASRNPRFMRESVRFIATLQPGGDLLDLGCGPGLYAELFSDAGFTVTGMDLSDRSIEYARTSARDKGKAITYVKQNYLSLAIEDAFDVITLIYCDFGVLAPDIRLRFLRKILRALRPGGRFIVDVFTQNAYKEFSEQRTITYEKSGFWSPEEYLCVKRGCLYGESVILEQYNVITAEAVQTYNIWNEMFTEETLSRVLGVAGFSDVSFYADVCGGQRSPMDKTLCAVATKA